MTWLLELIKKVHCTMLLLKCLNLFEGEVYFSQYMQTYSTAKHRAFIACYIAMSISLVFMYIFKSSFSFLLESIDVKNMLKTYQNVADFYNILFNR